MKVGFADRRLMRLTETAWRSTLCIAVRLSGTVVFLNGGSLYRSTTSKADGVSWASGLLAMALTLTSGAGGESDEEEEPSNPSSSL